METFFALVMAAGVLLILWVAFDLVRHKHTWQVVERGSVTYPGTRIRQGRYLVKECTACHKMKTECS